MSKALRLVLVASFALAGGLNARTLRAQQSLPAASPPETAAAAKITFEVASVKPNRSTTGPQTINLQPGCRLTVTGMPLRTLIRVAYGSEVIQTMGQIVGGPGWISTDRFDIVAKAEGDLGVTPNGPPTRLIAMLRALLAERFNVKVHTEMREVQTYALVLSSKDGKLGPQLKESKADCYSAASPPPAGGPPDPARLCGIRGGNGNVTYVSVTMPQIAASFANYPVVGRPVTDRTGLPGKYSLHMEFVPAFIAAPAGDGSQIADPAADSGPNLFTALSEQAGLKLLAEKGSVEFIVIDSAEPRRKTES